MLGVLTEKTIGCRNPAPDLRSGRLKTVESVTGSGEWKNQILIDGTNPADGLFVVPAAIDGKTASMLNINPTTAVLLPKRRKPGRCPVTMLDAWFARAKIKEGQVFRPVRQDGRVLDTRLSDRSVVLIVKRHVGYAGFTAEEFGGHSLRSGLATSATAAGQSERTIMVQTRHKSVEMARRYIQKGTLFEGNVVGVLDF